MQRADAVSARPDSLSGGSLEPKFPAPDPQESSPVIEMADLRRTVKREDGSLFATAKRRQGRSGGVLHGETPRTQMLGLPTLPAAPFSARAQTATGI